MSCAFADKIKWLVKNILKKILTRLQNLFFNKIKLHYKDGYHLYLKGTPFCIFKKHSGRLAELRYKKNLSIEEEKEVIQHMYFEFHQQYLDLDNPKTFNEKINWLKLYYRDPLITQCSDKYAVRQYIADKIGEEYLVPLLGVWDKAGDIDFDKLPEKFVLKVNWGSGQNIIVRDKSTLDIQAATAQLNRWMSKENNHYRQNMEWGYKNIKPKIIAEEYLDEFETENPADYKIYSIHGTPKILMYITGRSSAEHKRSFYSLSD